MRTIVAWSLSAVVVLGACSATGSPEPSQGASAASEALPSSAPPDRAASVPYTQPLRLVVLGDGYTHGTSTAAPNRDSWPAQLQTVTRDGDMRIRLVRNLAASSRTSEDVLVDQLPQVEGLQPDLVTVQVGANDIFTGTDVATYRANLADIFDGLLAYVPAGRIFAITSPDHELTERGRDLGRPGSDHSQVGEFNEALRSVAAERQIVVIDIAPIYELVLEDETMVVGGGPDPSARQYAGWVEIIGQGMRRSLSASEP